MRRLALWGFVAALAVTAAGVGCHPKRSSGVLTPDEDRLAVVRRELEARYAENEAGFIARDPDRVMRLRHPDFHTITPDGTVSTREQMYERTRNLIGRIERFDSLTETIISLTLEGDTAHAVVDQRTVRQQRLGDGALHEVRTSVVQRESWVKTAEGWLLWRVDEIQPGETLVDGIPLGKPQARADEPKGGWPPPPLSRIGGVFLARGQRSEERRGARLREAPARDRWPDRHDALSTSSESPDGAPASLRACHGALQDLGERHQEPLRVLPADD